MLKISVPLYYKKKCQGCNITKVFHTLKMKRLGKKRGGDTHTNGQMHT